MNTLMINTEHTEHEPAPGTGARSAPVPGGEQSKPRLGHTKYNDSYTQMRYWVAILGRDIAKKL